MLVNVKLDAWVDPGFPRGGGANSPGWGTYDFAKFPQKLHEIERIWTQGGGGERDATEMSVGKMDYLSRLQTSLVFLILNGTVKTKLPK